MARTYAQLEAQYATYSAIPGSLTYAQLATVPTLTGSVSGSSTLTPSILGAPALSGVVETDNSVIGTVVGIEGDFGDPIEPSIVSSGSVLGVLAVEATLSSTISVTARVSGFPTFPNVASEYVPKKVRATQIRIERFGEVVGFSLEDGKVRGFVTYPGTILGLELETNGKAIGTPTVTGSTFALTTKAAARIGGSVWLRGPEEEQLLDLLGVL